MEVAATFIALVFVTYLYLTVVGFRCALKASHIVRKAVGHEVGEEPTILQTMALPFILWVSGLIALLSNEEKYVARTAEMYMDMPKMNAADKRKIREAVRAYREKRK